MLNVYLIYITSLETGDVDTSKRVYTSFGKAISDMDNVVQQYISDLKIEHTHRIILKDQFDLKKLNKDTTIPLGGYVFKKKKSNVCIYKKVVVEGKVWNGSKLEKVGKIGILPEVNIPVDNKLLNYLKTIITNTDQEQIKEQNKEEPKNDDQIMGQNNDQKNENHDYEIPEAPVPPVPPVMTHVGDNNNNNNNEEYRESVAVPSNYEHGKHVSFIHELKTKLKTRSNKPKVDLTIQNNIQKENDYNAEHLKFISDLNKTKQKLQHITPPQSPDFGYGKVVNYLTVSESAPPPLPPFPDFFDFSNFSDGSYFSELPKLPSLHDFSDSEFQFPEVPDFPEVPEFPINEYNNEYNNEYSSELSASSEWDSSTDEIPSGLISPPTVKKYNNHIDKIVDDIMDKINNENINNENINESINNDNEYGDHNESINEYNDNYKYLYYHISQNRRLSL